MKLRAISAIAGIVILDMWAIMHGINGILFATCIGVIAGLGGYPVLDKIKENNPRVKEWLDGIK